MKKKRLFISFISFIFLFSCNGIISRVPNIQDEIIINNAQLSCSGYFSFPLYPIGVYFHWNVGMKVVVSIKKLYNGTVIGDPITLNYIFQTNGSIIYPPDDLMKISYNDGYSIETASISVTITMYSNSDNDSRYFYDTSKTFNYLLSDFISEKVLSLSYSIHQGDPGFNISQNFSVYLKLQ